MDDLVMRFQRLCREELNYLRGGVYRIVGNAADTDDVIQDALLRAWSKADSFRGEADLRSWVYRIAVNCAFDLIRERERRSEARQQYVANTNTSKSGNNEKQLLELEQAVSKLPDLYREAVVWGCLSDLSGSEAAARLGCSENTLYQRIFKAKKMLKTMMTQEVAK